MKQHSLTKINVRLFSLFLLVDPLLTCAHAMESHQSEKLGKRMRERSDSLSSQELCESDDQDQFLLKHSKKSKRQRIENYCERPIAEQSMDEGAAQSIPGHYVGLEGLVPNQQQYSSKLASTNPGSRTS